MTQRRVSNNLSQNNSQTNKPINESLDDPLVDSAQAIGRRQLLKVLAASSGAVVASSLLPNKWVKPVVEVGTLPAHAQGSPTGVPPTNIVLSFLLYLKNSHTSWEIKTVSSLDPGTTGNQVKSYDELGDKSLDPNITPNQHARVDIMDPTAPVDDTTTGVLQNVFITQPGDPLEFGYVPVTANLDTFSGQTIRLRFAEVDNQLYLNMGIDVVSIQANGGPNLVTNGTFETGLGGWTNFDNNNSPGTWSVQTGTVSPISGTPVAAPPEGVQAAMSDQTGPGTRIIYQDVTLP